MFHCIIRGIKQPAFLAWLLFAFFSSLPSFAADNPLESFIFSHSPGEPAKIVERVKQLPLISFDDLSDEALEKASHASAVMVDIPLTMKMTDLLIQRGKERFDNQILGKAYYNRGAMYGYAGLHDLALDAFLLALNYFESGENGFEVARIRAALALMYVEIGEYELAKPYFESSIAYHRQVGDKSNLSMVLQNRGFMKIMLGDLDGAKQDLEEALAIAQQDGIISHLPIILKNLGKVTLERGDPESAMQLQETALQASEKANMNHLKSEIFRQMAQIALKQKDLESSRRFVNDSVELGERFGLLKQLRSSYLLLADLEVASNDYKAAYLAKQKAQDYASQMGQSRIATNLSRLDRYTATLKESTSRELLERERKIAFLAAEQERLFKNLWLAIAVIAIMLAIYFVRQFGHSNRRAAHFEHQSKIDPLTGVWNRRAGEARLERLCARHPDTLHSFSVAVIDIDHFKLINDQLGHDVGDRAIIELSNLIFDSLRACDMLCRWGGEEFVLILDQSDQETAFDICERLRLTITNHTFTFDGSMSVSIGIASYQGDTLFELIKRGDMALYEAKKQGRNRVIYRDKQE